MKGGRAGGAGSPVAALVVLAFLILSPASAAGQEVRFSPRPDVPEERRLRDFVREGGYRLTTRDTVVAADDTVRTSLLVLEATVRLAGRVEGDVYVVSGDLFLRPGARIRGDVVVLGGGFYSSSRAEVDGGTAYRPELLLRVVPRDGGYEILHVEERQEAVDLDGLAGFHLPTYRRVDGWTFGWGGTVRATGLAWQPTLEGAVRLHTEGDPVAEATLRNVWHPTGTFQFGVEAERRTHSNDRWILGEFSNSFSYLFGIGDFRDYYRAERASAWVGWPEREGWGGVLSLNWEQAESLRARPLHVFFEDDEDFRPNPGVDDGRIWSLGAEVHYRRRTARSRLLARFRLEGADSTAAGEFSFLKGEATVAWRGGGWADHRVELFGIGRHDLAGSLPRQRWSALGGVGTLPTLGVLERRGPRLLFLEATYLVPVEPLRVPMLGAPAFFVRNAVGSAWREDAALKVEDNVMAGVRFLFLELQLAVDVTESELDPEVVLGATFPSRLRQ